IISDDKWSNWWSRARSAVRKSANLTIEGKNPAVVVLHEQALTLEDELAPARTAARAPKEFFDLIKTYYSEAAKRSVDVQSDFVDDIISMLAALATQFSQNCPADALEVTLMIDHAVRLGANAPTNCPTTQQLIEASQNAAEMIVQIKDVALQKDAFDALAQRPDAADQFERLMLISPADLLDDIVSRLEKMGRNDAAERAIDVALNEPLDHTQIIIWLWNKPGVEIANLPSHSTILIKLLEVLNDIDHRLVAPNEEKKARRQAIRAALSASKFKIYNETIDAMDEAMASVIRTKIDRLHNLAITMYEAMMGKIRENHFALFVKKKIAPWLDENVIWTTQAAYNARGEELNHIKEVLMPANAKQIGLAAEQGDLRENADWQAAIEERDMLVSRVRKINSEIAMARVLERSDVPRDSVGIGSKIMIRRLDNAAETEMTFLGPWDSNPDEKIYSYTTKLAQNLMGLAAGEKIELDFEGEVYEYEIVGIEAAI
ncbi:MAG TPA: GreA/GreB family elongation factor, partial [Phycisphaerae bacterium]|nr:GreA/GreB family elongation factor [Phycisphaerae bacterium]